MSAFRRWLDEKPNRTEWNVSVGEAFEAGEAVAARLRCWLLAAALLFAVAVDVIILMVAR